MLTSYHISLGDALYLALTQVGMFYYHYDNMITIFHSSILLWSKEKGMHTYKPLLLFIMDSWYLYILRWKSQMLK